MKYYIGDKVYEDTPETGKLGLGVEYRTDIPDECVRLQVDIMRLRGLIAAAEILGDGGGCPWCGRWESVGHRRSCRAFTPDGVVK